MLGRTSAYDEILDNLAEDSQGNLTFKSGHVLYLSSEPYSTCKKNPRYNSFHDRTVRLIKDNAKEIVSALPEKFTLIDLGPEYPDKTLAFTIHAKTAPDYVPVDINHDYLGMAEDAFRPHARYCSGIQSVFTDCATKIPANLYPHRVAFIGLTFMNDHPCVTMPILRKIAGRDGTAGVAAELLSRDNGVESILQGYKTSAVENFVYGPLQTLGIPRADLTYDARFENGRVELGFIFNKAVSGIGIEKDRRLIVIPSYRYTAESLAETLRAYGEPKIWTSVKRDVAFAWVR